MVVDLPAAVAVDDQVRRAVGRGVLVAPPHEVEDDGVEVAAAVGEPVLVPGRALGVAVALENAGVDQALEAVGEHVARHAQAALEVVEAPDAAEGVAQDEERPAFADELERARDRADLVVVRAAKHLPRGECRLTSCVTQPISDLGTRTRTITWTDPVEYAGRLAGLSGLEAMQAIVDGDVPVPPIGQLMDFRPIEVSDGHAVFAVQPAEFHYNPIGVVHGGLALTLLDSAMGCAVHTTLPRGTAYTTLEVNANLVRAITRDTGRLLAKATSSTGAAGRPPPRASSDEEQSGKLVAHGTTTCLVR